MRNELAGLVDVEQGADPPAAERMAHQEAPELVASLDLADGYPKLTRGLESSVPGLHFLGAPAAFSFGPIMRFVAGTWYAAPALARRIAGKRELPFRPSF